MPAMENVEPAEPEGRLKVRDKSFGKISIVHRPVAASSQWPCEFPKLKQSLGIVARILSMGRLGPLSTRGRPSCVLMGMP